MSAESPRSEADTPRRNGRFPLTDEELARRQAMCAMMGWEYVPGVGPKLPVVHLGEGRRVLHMWNGQYDLYQWNGQPDLYRWSGDPPKNHFRAGDTAAEQAAFDRMMAAAIAEEAGRE